MATTKRAVSAGLLMAVVGTVLAVGFAPASAEPAVVVEASSVPEGAESIDFADIARMMGGGGAPAKRSEKKLPDWKEVSDGFTQVISTADGQSFYNVYINKETNQLLAELPRGYERMKQFVAMTVSGGEIFAGLQGGDQYVQLRKINDRLAIIAPQLEVRSTGDQESKDSIEMIFTDRVITDMPIVANGPNGQPVIDLDSLLVGQAQKFFGNSARGLDAGLTVVRSVKAFPQNIEVEFEGPVQGGTIKRFHYSISQIQGTPGYKPRVADERVGYFTTSYEDFGKFDWRDINTRYINRWNLEKADPKLKMSPPKEPIVYYVEHTVPIRYRRWVREGIEYWNKAYRAIGIDGAIEVRFQDKASGQHMDKDPEDVRYNFIRWLANDVATAIGPSRVNPETGEILDADVVLTDGWIRVFNYRWNELLPSLATEGMSPSTMAWLERNPRWDPRVRLAEPAAREELLRQRELRGPSVFGGHALGASGESPLLGENEFDGLHGRLSQMSSLCRASEGKALGLATMRMYLDAMDMLMAAEIAKAPGVLALAGDDPEIDPETLEMIRKQLEANPELMKLVPEKYRKLLEGGEEPKEEEGEEPKGDDKPKAETKQAKEDDGDKLDGAPEWFVGPALAELVAHEVGHTLGLRHNFKGSSYYSFDQINSAEVKGKEPWSMSVMDYNGVNIRMPEFGQEQGDYSVINIGPYDEWAIEYGYGFGDPKKVAARAADPKLQYATDEDTWGPDPLARRYDIASDPLDWCRNQMALVKTLRESLLEHFVKDGDSWARARRGYQITLGQHVGAVNTMANWIGSAFVYRDKKGDPNGRAPIEVVPVERQRAALKFVVENTFRDEAFGLTPELLKYMTVDKWWDAGGMGDILSDPTFNLHDRILGVQASALTMLMNPQTLQRVHDLEAFVPADEDALTLPELMDTVTAEIWSELSNPANGRFSDRSPMISSIRRNLQREHLDRLIDLSMMNDGMNAAEKPVKQLAAQTLRDLDKKLEKAAGAGNADAYTRAHIGECRERIAKALDAQYIYNAEDLRPTMGFPMFLFGQQQQGDASGR
jgi:hypothetical protein